LWQQEQRQQQAMPAAPLTPPAAAANLQAIKPQQLQQQLQRAT
jgi:hypothetical protein